MPLPLVAAISRLALSKGLTNKDLLLSVPPLIALNLGLYEKNRASSRGIPPMLPRGISEAEFGFRVIPGQVDKSTWGTLLSLCGLTEDGQIHGGAFSCALGQISRPGPDGIVSEIPVVFGFEYEARMFKNVSDTGGPNINADGCGKYRWGFHPVATGARPETDWAGPATIIPANPPEVRAPLQAAAIAVIPQARPIVGPSPVPFHVPFALRPALQKYWQTRPFYVGYEGNSAGNNPPWEQAPPATNVPPYGIPHVGSPWVIQPGGGGIERPVPGYHAMSPPASNQVEKKGSARSNVAIVLSARNVVSEVSDAITAVYSALPYWRREALERSGRLNDGQMLVALWDYHEELDIENVALNLMLNHVGDMISGQLMRYKSASLDDIMSNLGFDKTPLGGQYILNRMERLFTTDGKGKGQ